MFLLLVTVRQSAVDELTQDCFSTGVEYWPLLCHDLSATPVTFAFCLSCRRPSRSLLAWGIVLMSAGAYRFHTSRAAAPVQVREERQTQVSWAIRCLKINGPAVQLCRQISWFAFSLFLLFIPVWASVMFSPLCFAAWYLSLFFLHYYPFC